MFIRQSTFLFIFTLFILNLNAQDILMQDGTFNQCSGTFFDSGGSSEDYSSGEDFSITICPDMPDMRIVLEFLSFEVIPPDSLTIYDSDSADPSELIGVFNGDLTDNDNAILTNLSASDTNTTGCLTLEFSSNTFFEGSGWEATISCKEPCQIIEAEIDNISPASLDNEVYTVILSETITFDGSAIFGNNFNQGATYEWDFGDGNTATGQTVQHSYVQLGTFLVNLTVTDDDGCVSFNTINQEVEVIFDGTNPGPGCPNVTGEDVIFDCDIPETTELTSSFLNTGETTSYQVEPIPYAPPFPYTGLSNPISVNTDDTWSPVIDLPFDFCFFGSVRDQIVVGSNGIISFDIGNANGTNGYSLDFGDNIPNSTNSTISEGNIMLTHDIDPSVVVSNPEIAWEIIGEAPCRTFVVSYSSVAHYSVDCNSFTSTFMMIMYETTNAIEFYIDEKPTCAFFNDGLAGLGIQNDAGTIGFSPPSRNTGVWSASQEAWRFTPNGDPNVTFQWFDPAGNFFSSDPTITVPVNQDETYLVEATYTNCNGDQVVVSDEATIDINPAFDLSLSASENAVCEGLSDSTLNSNITFPADSNIDISDIEYEWFQDGNLLSETTSSITVDTPGVYILQATGGPCIITEEITISEVSIPEITQTPTLTQCGDFTLAQVFDLAQNDASTLGISNVPNAQLTYYTLLSEAEAGVNSITDPANYTISANSETIFVRAENIDSSECFTVDSFIIQTFDVEANQVEGINICGTTGQATFNLTQQNANIFGSNQDSTTHSISYHTSQADAQGGDDPIADPSNYSNTNNPEIIWSRVQNIADPTCFALASFEVSLTDELEITQTPSLSACDDFSGNQVFDLTQNDAAALGIANAADAQLTYYTSQSDADAGINFIADPANYISSANSETIFVRAESVDSNECFSVDSFSLQIFDTEANPPQNISVCEPTGNTGQTTFNLTQQNAVIFGPNQDSTTHSISYHTSQADAQGGADPIDDPANYTNSNNPETLWARVQSLGDPSCFALTSFEVSITEEPEILNPPADLLECGDFTGSQTFDLSQYDAINLGILNPAETLITYHNTAANANTGDNPIADPANYVPANLQEDIFIRAVNINDDQCFVTTSFSIEVFNVEILPAGDLESCDDGNGTATSSFDLTSNNLPVLGSNQSITTHNVTYYENETDATAGTGAIDNPIAYDNISSPQTVWVRVENINNTDCFEVSSFELLVTDSAPINTDIDPLIACDDDNDGFFNNFDLNAVTSLISFDNPDVAVSYHLTPDDAQNSVGALSSPYANVVESLQTLYFRATDTNNGCEQFGDFELQVFDSPLLTPIEEPLIGCDDNNDDILFFDLTQIEAEVLGGLDPDPLVITYHTSLSDAQNGINEIIEPDAFQNTTNPQTIWIRVTDSNSPGGCFDIEAFDIIVEPTPDIVNPEPFEICDDEDSGDLSDEIATFDLNDKISEITQGNNELNVEFFVSQADLDNDNPISPIDAYVNIANPQTLEVRVTSGTNGCESFTTLTLVVNPVPSMAPELEPLEVCDPDNDGFAEFDLQATIVDILNNEPDVSISFHLTQADAELGVNPIDISNPFGTSNPGQQTIYVRAENTGPNGDDGTGCFDTRPLDLIVIPSPEIENLDDLSRCDDESPNGFASFDLTVNTNLAIGNQEPADLQVTYHETQSDAEQGINPIAIPTNYTNITNPQLIYVRIENTATGCVDLFDAAEDVNNTFTLTVEPLPVVNPPSVLEVCDDDNNQDPFPQTTFDLTVKQAEIIGQTIVPANLQFSYYESQDDVDNDNPIADPTAYANISQPQSIIVTVIDTATENNCFDSTVLTISVLPLPSPSETDPEVLRLQGCDDDNDGVANQAFDLTESGILIAGSETVELSYYLTESAADTQDPALLIGSPEAYVNQPSFNLTDDNGNPTNVQLIYVRVDNAVPGNFCYVIVPVELVTNSAPVLNPNGNPFAYTLCEDEDTNPGQATLFSLDDIANNLWDFTAGSSDVIIPLLDPDAIPAQSLDDVVVSYHFTEQDAEDGINAIAPGQPVSNGDILFIRLSNPETSCFNTGAIGQLQMVIEPRPAIAADNPDDIVVCAEDINSPAIGTVDLTQQDEAINPGAPDNTMVVYYAGMMNYNNATPVEDPGSITTTQSPQTIIAEVVNTVTLCESSNFVSFDIIVDPLPNVDISGFEGDIVCFDSGGNLINNEVSPPTIDTGLSEDLYDFVWTLNGGPFPGSSSSIEATSPGVYTVTVTDTQSGCVAGSSAEIIESTPPEFNVSVLTPSFSENHVVEVNTITGNGDFEFRLDDGPWVSLEPGQTTLIFSNIAPGLHVISGRDSGGCGEIEISFNVIDFPPFFTPNQDGINETWNITSLSDQPNAKIYIFDRYGKLLKQLNPAGEGWDGTFNGKNMPAQDYWFRVEFNEPQNNIKSTFKAHFTLKR